MRRKKAKLTASRRKSATKLHLTATRHPIHFDDLSPSDFERMCLWLVREEGYIDPEHVGLLGGDDGCDVKAWKWMKGGRKLWWFQCKRRAKVDRLELIREVEKIHASAVTTKAVRPDGICFVLASPVSAATRKAVEYRCAALGYASRWWAKSELDMLVKSHPHILDEFAYLIAARTIESKASHLLHQLPSAPRDFTGRKSELNALMKMFEAGKESALLSCIRGMAGVGKTALALVAANSLADRFPDGQIFLDLRGASEQRALSPAEAMARVIRAFHPMEELPKETERITPIYRSILHDKRVLLLFDNALDADQVRPLVPPETCWMLITSRQRFQMPGLAVIDLDVLPKKYACELLRRICRRIREADESIAGLCGYLPLALRAAGSLLEVRQDLSASEYAKLLTDEQSRLRRLGREGTELSIEASLALSYRMLPKNLRQPFCMLAVFRGMIHTSAASGVWQVKPETSRDRLGALLHLSLLDWDEKAHRYHLHELIRLFANSRLTASNRRQAQLGHAICFCFNLAHAQELYLKGGQSMMEGLAFFDAEWANINAGHEWVVANAPKDKGLRRLPSLYAHACAEFLTVRLHPQQRIAWLEPALDAAKSLKDAHSEGQHLTGLGIAYYDWGNPHKAMKCHKRVLTLARKIKDRRAEGGALCNLGNCSFVVGDMAKAIRYHERSLHISRELSDRRGEGKSLGNLANAYSHLGERERALDYYRQQLEIAKEIGDREQEGNALGGMGVTFSDPDETSLAIDCCEKALVIAREMRDRRSEGGAIGALARRQFAIGNVSRAIDLCREALDIERSVGDRRGEAISLENLGTYYQRQGDTKEAAKHWLDAISIFRDLGDRQGEAYALVRLGKMYVELADHQASLPYLQEALPILHELGDQRNEADCMANLATVYSLWNMNALAIELLRQATDLYHQLKDRVNEGGTLCNLGDRYARTNRAELAIECCSRALEILREAGATKIECDCLCNLANAHQLLGDVSKAKEYCEKQLHLARDIGDKLQEANALCGMAILYSGEGDHERAITGYKCAVELHGEVGDYANKGNDLFNLARELGVLGRQQDAVRTLEEAIATFETIGSPRATEARALLGLVRHAR